jgi:hypothetical protein
MNRKDYETPALKKVMPLMTETAQEATIRMMVDILMEDHYKDHEPDPNLKRLEVDWKNYRK